MDCGRIQFALSKWQCLARPIATGDDEVEELIGSDVVIDVAAQYVFLGRLADVGPDWVVLKQADVHDLRDSKTTRELYVLDSRNDGIRVNRRRVLVPVEQIVSVSLLDDVAE